MSRLAPSRARRRLLTTACAAAVAVSLGGCTENFCSEIPSNNLVALKQGVFCFGRDDRDSKEGPSPFALFRLDPNVVESGGTVRLDASGSRAITGISRIEWDLDGEPGFELDAAAAVIERQFTQRPGQGDPELREIRLRVTEKLTGDTAVSSQTLEIRAPAFGPRAVMQVRPNPARVGQTVMFDGAGSRRAVDYEWDFEGDGRFVRKPALRRESLALFAYETPGTRRVALRVTDASGATATDALDLVVTQARAAATARAAAVRALAAARPRPFRAKLTRVRFPDDLGPARRRGEVTAFRGVAASGRLVAPARGLGPLRRFRRARWTARLNVFVDVAARRARVRGHALARFPSGAGHACVRLRMSTRKGGAPRGRITLLGGRGAASHLRGGGRFRFRFRGATPSPDGRLAARLGQPRPLPGVCSGLR
jgi:PKD domain